MWDRSRRHRWTSGIVGFVTVGPLYLCTDYCHASSAAWASGLVLISSSTLDPCSDELNAVRVKEQGRLCAQPALAVWSPILRRVSPSLPRTWCPSQTHIFLPHVHVSCLCGFSSRIARFFPVSQGLRRHFSLRKDVPTQCLAHAQACSVRVWGRHGAHAVDSVEKTSRGQVPDSQFRGHLIDKK